MFFSIVETAASSIFYGVITTCAVMAILYFILKSVDRGIVKTLAFYLTGIALAILLFIQFSLLSGAYQAKGTMDSAVSYIGKMTERLRNKEGINDSKRLLDAVLEEYPIICSFVDVSALSEQDMSTLAETVQQIVSDSIRLFIWRRVLWITGFVLVACIIAISFRGSGETSKNSAMHISSVGIATRKKYNNF